MKIDRRRAPLLFLLLASVVSCDNIQTSHGRLAKRDPVPAVDKGTSGPVGTEHAPVDGKDGMPHEGPWIETETDRKNQKMKDVGEEAADYTTSTSSTKEMPDSNDGVMDDRNRKAPTDGTRGTEGGVSQRGKDGKPVGKEPNRPKEARPLPPSEKQRMGKADDSDDETVVGESDEQPRKPQKFEVSPLDRSADLR